MSDTCQIIVPPHAALFPTLNEKGEREIIAWSYARCIQWLIDTNPQIFNTGGMARASAARIFDIIDGKQPGDTLPKFKDTDRNRLREAFENPAKGLYPELKNSVTGELTPIPPRFFAPFEATLYGPEDEMPETVHAPSAEPVKANGKAQEASA